MGRSRRFLSELVSLPLAALLFVACQHKPPIEQGQTLQKHIAEGQTLYERHIQKLTFDRAMQKWGSPQSVVEGAEIRAVVWETITEHAGKVAVPVPMFKSIYSMDTYYTPVYVDRSSHGERLDCTFSKSTGLLQTIRYSAW